ncbi:NAD(P)/FAD-dependent oxidoreductase [Brachybacterium sp. YJGR34]|uniref:FAD-dependent oxidoreductase n=1 Tax=Brachybacterium sp. YJGR34 TaxID=2059911 RepID=UPI000E0A2402|nr:NAD(P)/FAD-dependent oxidoreductase [Brachybacterium sp. YJGR34]
MHPTLTIRILGAGVSGLAAAIALARDGHHVELIDESFDIPAVGTSIGLFGSAQRVLEDLGVLDAVRRRSAAPRAGSLRSGDGALLATAPAGDVLLAARSDLVRHLQDAVPGSVQQVRRRVDDVRPLRRGADLLLGADGVHSLVRRSGWGSRAAARSHGVTVLRGTAPLDPPDVSETWGRGWLFGMTPLAGGGTNWFACIGEHRTGSVAGDLAHLREVLGGRRPEIDAVLAAATPEQTLVHGIHTVPPVVPVKEHVALLGDAAHAMAPNLGHGANTALQDVGALAEALRAAGGGPEQRVRHALRSYALVRTLPDQSWRLASSAMMSLAMTARGASARDRLLRSLGTLSPASARAS